jgi:hypothetical protein
MGVVFVLLLLGLFGALRATLTMGDAGIELRYFFGMRRRNVPFPASIEVGALTQRRASPVLPNVHEEVKAGTYLRLSGGSSNVTVGSTKGTGFRKHWSPAGWRAASKLGAWDITISREDLVRLEYQLAHRGMLTASLRSSCPRPRACLPVRLVSVSVSVRRRRRRTR